MLFSSTTISTNRPNTRTYMAYHSLLASFISIIIILMTMMIINATARPCDQPPVKIANSFPYPATWCKSLNPFVVPQLLTNENQESKIDITPKCSGDECKGITLVSAFEFNFFTIFPFRRISLVSQDNSHVSFSMDWVR